MATKTLSVITPVWNQANHTAHFLRQNHLQFVGYPDVEFIIINNGSTDNTAEILATYPYVTIINNDKNEGFPIACNQGAKVAKGDILLFLNNDIIIWSDYVSPLQEIMADDIIAGTELYSYNTGWNVFGDTLIRYVAGWCLAITKATFEALGGFDERYSPCDYEDIDLCYNAALKGYKLIQLPLPIRHISGQSGMANRREITEANRLKFAEKWNLPL